ncbi:unnamed protein product [Phytomonas sp. Hart1]|nr:unnamed protein product [Phytomonas sp. Hart1]|eukprot:CCW68072.1 unnamed protein product [Phytomonas sp. isolate Hart1]
MPSSHSNRRAHLQDRQAPNAPLPTSRANATLPDESSVVDRGEKGANQVPNPISSPDLPNAGLVETIELTQSSKMEADEIPLAHFNAQPKTNALPSLLASAKAEGAPQNVANRVDPTFAFTTRAARKEPPPPSQETVEKAVKLASPPPNDVRPLDNNAIGAEMAKVDPKGGVSHSFRESSSKLVNGNPTRQAPPGNPSETDPKRDVKREREGTDSEKDKEGQPIPSLRRLRKGKRSEAIQEDHSLFIKYRELRTTTPQSFPKAPYAQAKDILASLNEWTIPPEIMYARLLWKYTPDAFLALVMRKTQSEGDNTFKLKEEPDEC